MNDSRGCGSCRHFLGDYKRGPRLCDVWQDEQSSAKSCTDEDINYGCEYWRQKQEPRN
jgi:hypothetical protein